MTATWTAPRTWADNDLVSASDLNEQLRDNLEWVKGVVDNGDSYECDEASNYTTTNTSFVNVDATNLALTISSNGGDLLVGFFGTIANGGWITFFDVELDGERVGADDGLISAEATDKTPIGFVTLLKDVDADSHTVKLQWKTSGGTSTLYAGAGTTNADMHPQFWVQEV